MGVFTVPLEIWDVDALRFERVEALVDTGAIYNVAPASILRGLGVVPLVKRRFELADGGVIEREVSQTWVGLRGERFIAPVVFGGEGVRPILGAVTLEIFGLGVDPVNKSLIPVSSPL